MNNFIYNGVPVFSSDLAEKSIEKIKRFKRLNRPDKLKIKIIHVPCLFRVSNRIYIHPKLIKKLKVIGVSNGKKNSKSDWTNVPTQG